MAQVVGILCLHHLGLPPELVNEIASHICYCGSDAGRSFFNSLYVLVDDCPANTHVCVCETIDADDYDCRAKEHVCVCLEPYTNADSPRNICLATEHNCICQHYKHACFVHPDIPIPIEQTWMYMEDSDEDSD